MKNQQAQSVHSTRAEASQMKEERLPFTIKIVRTESELEKAVYIRQAAYARHVPEIAAILKEPEPLDYSDNSVVLLAESKLDGSPLGSMRIQTNLTEKLKLESSVRLPEWLQGHTQAEAARLGVVGNSVGRMVTTTLFKAFYLYCLDEGIEWMIAVARPVVDKQYKALLFQDVFPEIGYMPMPQHANIAHRVMALNVASVEPSWKEVNHPLYDYFFHTCHPDLSLYSEEGIMRSRKHLSNIMTSRSLHTKSSSVEMHV